MELEETKNGVSFYQWKQCEKIWDDRIVIIIIIIIFKEDKFTQGMQNIVWKDLRQIKRLSIFILVRVLDFVKVLERESEWMDQLLLRPCALLRP